MRRSVYIAVLSAMVVLVFAAIASAQDSTDQYSSDQYSTGPATDSSADQAQSPTPGQQENTPTVSILASGFDPPQLEVASGTPVTFVNEDSVPHTVSLEGLFDSPEIPSGYSYPVTLDGTGTVAYHDKANPEMQGILIVGGANGGGSTVPTSNTPQETTAPQLPTQQSGMGG